MKHRKAITGGALAALALAAVCAAPAAVARAQVRGEYVVSARAGGVNLISGDVTVRRRGANRAEALTPQDTLDSGDAVTTGAGGRAEVLLLPGSYLRVGENSELEFVDASPDSLRVRLVRGSAVVEAAGEDDARSLVEVATPQTTVTVDKRGLYRVDALPDGATEVYVRKGRALVSDAAAGAVKVEGGKYAAVRGGQVIVAKFDKKLDRDGFDSWSAGRAEALAAANKRLSESARTNSYDTYRRGGLGFVSRRSPGLWVYDPFFGGSTFLPFYRGLSSPYGHGYRHGFGFSAHRHYAPLFPTRRRGVFASPHPGARREHRTGVVNHGSPAHVSSGHHRRGH